MVRGLWCKKLKYEKGTIDLSGHLLPSAENPREVRQAGGQGDLRLPDDEGELVQFRSEDGSPSQIAGFATRWAPYCTGELKQDVLKFSESAKQQGANKNSVVSYIGIAIDEPKRLARLDGISKVSPLAAIGWTEADCYRICEENDLLSPIYTTATRGGCWFCHNQGIDQLRLLRKNYPDLWALLLKWDNDSPVSFRPDGHTVRDFDRRFQLEDEEKVPRDRRFRWKMIDGRYCAEIEEKSAI